ncbi:MAG: response regulator transcription factor [Anaerolineaceae bacterium]|nr:response regulator transcription factor [Anaerolineaceae bacterium]
MDTEQTHQIPIVLEEGMDLDQVSAERRRVLVVEDEPDTVFLLKQILRIAGFNVLSAYSGKEALKKVSEHKPDAVLLDIMLPEMDGWETLGYLRQMTDAPVVVVSALGSKQEVVDGLNRGVDDYITKPFYNAEVVARVEAVLRRANQPREVSRLVFPEVDLVVDLMAQQISLRGQVVQLTPKEFGLMAVLAKHAPAIVSYATIGQAVWGQDNADIRKRMKYLVYLLRRKFEQLTNGSELIVNVGRFGYKLQTEL